MTTLKDLSHTLYWEGVLDCFCVDTKTSQLFIYSCQKQKQYDWNFYVNHTWYKNNFSSRRSVYVSVYIRAPISGGVQVTLYVYIYVNVIVCVISKWTKFFVVEEHGFLCRILLCWRKHGWKSSISLVIYKIGLYAILKSLVNIFLVVKSNTYFPRYIINCECKSMCSTRFMSFTRQFYLTFLYNYSMGRL